MFSDFSEISITPIFSGYKFAIKIKILKIKEYYSLIIIKSSCTQFLHQYLLVYEVKCQKSFTTQSGNCQPLIQTISVTSETSVKRKINSFLFQILLGLNNVLKKKNKITSILLQHATIDRTYLNSNKNNGFNFFTS